MNVLNTSSNSFSLNTVSFKTVFTVGRYDLKVRLHYGILLARFGPMLRKNSLNFSAMDFASCISIFFFYNKWDTQKRKIK